MKHLDRSSFAVQQQRDVYTGLLEKATEGYCTFQKTGIYGPCITDVSPKLQRLLRVTSEGVPAKKLIKSAYGIAQLLALDHAETSEQAAEPAIVTVRTHAENADA